jgi:DNA invertase Pin-like site-specific DNA recombinase
MTVVTLIPARIAFTLHTTVVVRNVNDAFGGIMTGKYVSYLRVSTARQGKSGLGLEAQREAVSNYLNGGRWTLVDEIIEVESGKRNNRPQLAKALRLCRLHKATLLVAKLDRLARNVAFISALMESGVKFQAVDMPDVNDMVLHILASVAQGEAKAISDRTKAALAAAKARGTQLGGLRWDINKVGDKGRRAALETRQEKAVKYRADIMPIIEEHQRNGVVTLAGIAAALNADGTPAPRGGEWSAVQVKRILAA